MRISIGIANFQMEHYTQLIRELAYYAACSVTKEGGEVTVRAEGDVVECMCVVAVCDRYRFGEEDL